MFNEEIFMKDVQDVTMDATTLLDLPSHLRKTGIAILKFEQASVDQIAAEIGASPRKAKNNLDRLTLMKMLNKKREGDQLVYYNR
jgi:predicted ArsR family transcriptional regulator